MMGLLDSLLDRFKSDADNKTSQSREAKPQSIDAHKSLETTLVNDSEIVQKFQYISSILKKSKAGEIQTNSVMKHDIFEYKFELPDNNGPHICEIRSTINTYQTITSSHNNIEESFHHKREVIMPVFDTDGDGDIDKYDTQKFVISDHGSGLRFLQCVVGEDEIGHFEIITPQKGKAVLERIEEFVTKGNPTNKGLEDSQII